jgi:hypothetical protein
MIEVRALGYYPDRRPVHILSGAAPVRISLSTLESVLDTVKIRSNRLSTRDKTGFADRRHSGPGRYFTAAQIAKRPAVFTSDIFKTIPGVRLGYASDTLATDMAIAISPDDISLADKRILMRGISGDWCAPAIFLDGVHIHHFGAEGCGRDRGLLRGDGAARIPAGTERVRQHRNMEEIVHAVVMVSAHE